MESETKIARPQTMQLTIIDKEEKHDRHVELSKIDKKKKITSDFIGYECLEKKAILIY